MVGREGKALAERAILGSLEPEQRRAEQRERRRAEAVPVREWMKSERERLLAQDVIPPVQRMYAESLRLSDRWAREFRQFWDLPDDFDFDIETPEVDVARTLQEQGS